MSDKILKYYKLGLLLIKLKKHKKYTYLEVNGDIFSMCDINMLISILEEAKQIIGDL